MPTSASLPGLKCSALVEIQTQLPFCADDVSFGAAAIGKQQLAGDRRQGQIVTIVQPQDTDLHGSEDRADKAIGMLKGLGLLQREVRFHSIRSSQIVWNL